MKKKTSKTLPPSLYHLLPEEERVKKRVPRKTVSQHTKIINAHFSRPLNKMEVRLHLALLERTWKKDTELKFFKINISDLSSKHLTFEEVRAFLKKASELIVEVVKIKEDGSKSYVPHNLFRFYEYTEHTKEIYAALHDDVQAFYLNLPKGSFTAADFELLSKVEEFNPNRTLWLLKETEGKGQNQRLVEYMEYRKMLGIPDEEYPRYSNFRIRVLEPILNRLQSVGYNCEAEAFQHESKLTTHILFTILGHIKIAFGENGLEVLEFDTLKQPEPKAKAKKKPLPK